MLNIIFLQACVSLHKVSYECPSIIKKNICVMDTIQIIEPFIVTIYRGNKHNHLILPSSKLDLVKKHSRFSYILKHGGYLIGTNIDFYITGKTSTVSLENLTVKEIRIVGKNVIREFDYPVTKFTALSVNVGCYNNLERFIGWIPLRGNDSDYVKVIFPLK